jgi:hypothetical protein
MLMTHEVCSMSEYNTEYWKWLYEHDDDDDDDDEDNDYDCTSWPSK